MAKNEYLRVFREAVHPMDPEEFEGAPNEAIEEGQSHRWPAFRLTSDQVKTGWGVNGPFRGRPSSDCR
jgi:hypothetical protein